MERSDSGHLLLCTVLSRLAGAERRAHRALQRRENSSFLAKSHLSFGGVHVDVNQRGIDADIDGGDRMASPFEAPLVAVLQRVRKGTGGDRPPVDCQDDTVACAAAELRL